MKHKEWILFCHTLKIGFKNLQQTFETIPRRSLVGGGALLLVSLLVVNKFVFRHKEESPIIKTPRVEVIHSTTQAINPVLNLSAETKANAVIAVRAEIAGKITEIIVDKGQDVSAQQPLLKIVDNDRFARLSQAQSSVDQRLAEYNSAAKLKSKNFVAENSLLQAKANLETANAELARAEYEYEQLIVKSPIQGYYQDRVAEVGNYVAVGDKLATIADLSVLLLNVYVNENDISDVKLAQTAKVAINHSYEQIKAKVTYISKVADPKTHTYLVELTIDNKKLLLPEGLTAKVAIEKDIEHVHVLKPSVLILDDQGLIGIMIVEQDNKAIFKPVEILQAAAENIYVKGLPETVTIISSGAEFIKNGHVVEPILANTVAAPA